MILLLDLGNTRLKWVQAHARRDWRDLVEVEAAEHTTWHQSFYALPCPQRVLACSVGQQHIRDFLDRAVLDVWGLKIEWLTVTREALGIENRYRVLTQQGPDRWASVLGARSLFPDEALVIANAGTALTVEAVTADGVYLGGSIQPGYRLMKQSLFQGTARLPLADGHVHDYPTSTEDAIESGCISALSGSIEAMFKRLTGRAEEPRLVLTGGDAERLSAFITTPHKRVENLVLHGLAALAFSTQPLRTEPDA
ncbi:type III pantothenate kinase [Silvimonas amylolytica]|uniref:Type III pantothenate kinase n=1 Tax=Silvimonas amylolytica TaxID=449663 RepID=A0ABQ2PPY7_9NEIS|nr:type III pantothenate kinase [Silvimonas amylolytica]GGP27687.1 type III pantothenate kinase [Silvimonas amylolytica]